MNKDTQLPYELWEDSNHLWNNEDLAAKGAKTGVKINTIDEFNSTALHLAVYYNDLSTVKKLVESRVDLELRNSKGQTALSVAASNTGTSFEILEYLVNSGANIECKDLNGYTPLVSAILSENLNYFAYKENEEIPFLLKNNASANAMSLEGNPPLVYAAIKGNPHTVKKLLEYKANINFQNENLYTPTMIAVMFENVQAFQVFLSFNPDLSMRNMDGKNVEDLVIELENDRMLAAYRDR